MHEGPQTSDTINLTVWAIFNEIQHGNRGLEEQAKAWPNPSPEYSPSI